MPPWGTYKPRGRKVDKNWQRDQQHTVPTLTVLPAQGGWGCWGPLPRTMGLPPVYSSQPMLLWILHPGPSMANTVPTEAEDRKRKSSANRSISTPSHWFATPWDRVGTTFHSSRKGSCPCRWWGGTVSYVIVHLIMGKYNAQLVRKVGLLEYFPAGYYQCRKCTSFENCSICCCLRIELLLWQWHRKMWGLMDALGTTAGLNSDLGISVPLRQGRSTIRLSLSRLNTGWKEQWSTMTSEDFWEAKCLGQPLCSASESQQDQTGGQKKVTVSTPPGAFGSGKHLYTNITQLVEICRALCLNLLSRLLLVSVYVFLQKAWVLSHALSLCFRAISMLDTIINALSHNSDFMMSCLFLSLWGPFRHGSAIFIPTFELLK